MSLHPKSWIATSEGGFWSFDSPEDNRKNEHQIQPINPCRFMVLLNLNAIGLYQVL